VTLIAHQCAIQSRATMKQSAKTTAEKPAATRPALMFLRAVSRSTAGFLSVPAVPRRVRGRLRPSELRPGRLVTARAGCGRHETPGTCGGAERCRGFSTNSRLSRERCRERHSSSWVPPLIQRVERRLASCGRYSAPNTPVVRGPVVEGARDRELRGPIVTSLPASWRSTRSSLAPRPIPSSRSLI
jgi:hypothetical protein